MNTQTPPGDNATQRSAVKPAFSHDLLGQVLSRSNLQAAWAQVGAKKGAAGITIDDFPAWARDGHWLSTVQELEQGKYCPDPVRCVE